MSAVLLWLAAPLLLLPMVARRDRLGAAAGQLIVAGLGLAALLQGAGSLDPRDLREIANQSSGGAWFVGITMGALITGACLLPDIRHWRSRLVAAPLLIGLVLSVTVHAALALVLGGLIGCLPATLGRSSGGGTPAGPPAHGASAYRRPASLLLGGVAIVMAAAGPALFAAVAWCALGWHEWQGLRTARGARTMPILPAAGTLLVGVWTWLALTIAASSLVGLRAFATDAPVSPAAGEWLALLAVGWGIAMTAPWPLDRLADVRVQLPVAAVVLYLAVACATPDGVAHWQPLLSVILVPVAIVAAASRRWDGAAAALLLLAATRPGPGSLAAALVVALAPAGRRLATSDRLRSGAAGVGVALLVATLLRDQVLLAVILALGLAVLANRHDHVVAPA